jgi:hypothetical protein
MPVRAMPLSHQSEKRGLFDESPAKKEELEVKQAATKRNLYSLTE